MSTIVLPKQQMRARARAAFKNTTRRIFKAKPAMTGSEYADRYGKLVEGGRVMGWETYEFQREILDALCDSTVPELVVMKSARMGISECLNHAQQYWLHYDPQPVAMYRPNQAMAEGYMRKRFDVRLMRIKEMREIAYLTPTGKKTETLLERHFKNGASYMCLGAEAEDNMSDHTLKKIYLDEFDRDGYAPVKGGGDKWDMARRRLAQFWDGQISAISTPKFPVEEGGRMHRLFLGSDQRHRHVCCPHCGYDFVPHWGDAESIGGMRWNKENPEEVWYECHNPDLEERCRIEEHHKIAMDKAGRWVPHRPEEKIRRGYHLWAWFSRAPKSTWKHIVREWLEACASGPTQIQSFKNEVLGLPFSNAIGQASAEVDALMGCIADCGGEVPAWAVGLVWGVDRQRGGLDESQSYLEASLWAFGPGRRPFLVGHWILDEFPQNDPRAWDALEALAARTFVDSEGRPRRADALAIDHNGGSSNRVVEWLARMRKKPGRAKWVAVRGESRGNGARGKSIWPTTGAKNVAGLYTIDVDLVKDELGPILAEGMLEFNANPIEGSIDFSDKTQAERYFKRLLQEKQYPVPGRPGLTIWKAPKGLGRNGNEPGDCFGYAYAMTWGLAQMAGGQRWRRLFGRENKFQPAAVRPLPPIEEMEDGDEVAPDQAPAPQEATRIKVPKNPMANRPGGPPRPGLIRVGRF